MAGGLRYESGRDMPPGMQEIIANQYIRRMKQAAQETDEPGCVSCGDVIPEGRQVCPNCERSAEDGG